MENEEIDNSLLFLDKEELILDILIMNNILYILYKTGKFIIYDIKTKKIEKYIICNLIDKGKLLHLKDNIVIIIIKENKSEFVQFHLIKNYIIVKLKEIIAPEDFYSYQYIFQNNNLFYFYAINDTLKIFSMNLTNHHEILREKDHKEIKYETYLDIINKLKDENKNLNEKYYEFDSIFQRSDVNKNALIITNIIINDSFNMICSFSDGSIMYYIIDIDRKIQNNYIINKIIYKYLIKVNFLSINDVTFVNNINNNNENYLATTSAEQSLKITDPSKCNILNIHFKPNSKNNIKEQLLENNYIINKSFTNLFSNYFFTQSIKESNKFSDNFSLPENVEDTSIEVLIYSYFENNKDKNYDSIKKIIEYANNKNKSKKQNIQYIEAICDYFTKEESKSDKLIFEKEKDMDIIMDVLIESNCYVECLLYVKYKNLGLDVFINCLEKIKKSIYIKQLSQATKIEKIIEYYKNNFKIIYI